jgi:abortive infection bacteriophage resistance protein
MTLYTKPALTFDEQVDQLLRRGMVGDRESIKSRLSTVNYYRLSAYWYPFRKRCIDPTLKAAAAG